MKRIRFCYEELPDYIRPGVITYNKGHIEFDNGSRIIVRAANSHAIRGLSVNYVYLDELAYIPQRIAEELWQSLMPCLSTGGKCIVTSTPNQSDDVFAQIWRKSLLSPNNGHNGFTPLNITWKEHPERDEIWAQNERSALGEYVFAREHMNQFVDAKENPWYPMI